MEYLKHAIDFVLHLDQHLDGLVTQFGPWLYVILFVIVFCETGLVITPFLPGDSLLFAVGALTAREGGLNFWIVLVVLSAAASPPKTQTQGRKRSCFKRHQAPRPSSNIPKGAKSFAKSTGPREEDTAQSETIKRPETPQAIPGISVPSQFKSSQKLRKFPRA